MDVKFVLWTTKFHRKRRKHISLREEWTHQRELNFRPYLRTETIKVWKIVVECGIEWNWDYWKTLWRICNRVKYLGQAGVSRKRALERQGEETASDLPDVRSSFLAVLSVRARGLGKWRILVPCLCLLPNMQLLVREWWHFRAGLPINSSV